VYYTDTPTDSIVAGSIKRKTSSGAGFQAGKVCAEFLLTAERETRVSKQPLLETSQSQWKIHHPAQSETHSSALGSPNHKLQE